MSDLREYVCECESVNVRLSIPLSLQVIVWLGMSVFVLIYALNGHVCIRVGLHVCFSQPSLH